MLILVKIVSLLISELVIFLWKLQIVPTTCWASLLVRQGIMLGALQTLNLNLGHLAAFLILWILNLSVESIFEVLSLFGPPWHLAWRLVPLALFLFIISNYNLERVFQLLILRNSWVFHSMGILIDIPWGILKQSSSVILDHLLTSSLILGREQVVRGMLVRVGEVVIHGVNLPITIWMRGEVLFDVEISRLNSLNLICDAFVYLLSWRAVMIFTLLPMLVYSHAVQILYNIFYF